MVYLKGILFKKNARMISKIFSAFVYWLEWEIVEVEVDMSPGIPSFTIVWLADQWVQESKERIKSALKSIGHKIPPSRITINLAPADKKKTGVLFDLPIALWILEKMNVIPSIPSLFEKCIFVWELALDGTLRKVHSILPIVLTARQIWFESIVLPYQNVHEVSFLWGIRIIPIKHLREIIEMMQGTLVPREIVWKELKELQKEYSKKQEYDFQYIVWHYQAKRACEIVAAGWHNILLMWPPWSGKTLLAQSIQSILPEMTEREIIEVSKIYSVSWLLHENYPLVLFRPFRKVHHTASVVSIIWWWKQAKPGEISLAHRGVLFFDEVGEFPKHVLESLRQPLEDGTITVTRIHGTYMYPAQFIFVGTLNPCPCGYLYDQEKTCTCTRDQIKRYLWKLSGPLKDRIDIFLFVRKVETQELARWKHSFQDSSADIQKRVQKAYEIQKKRFYNTEIGCNARIPYQDIQKYCICTKDAEAFIYHAIDAFRLSTRSYHRILKVARTIADLEEKEYIEEYHIGQSLAYRKGLSLFEAIP